MPSPRKIQPRPNRCVAQNGKGAAWKWPVVLTGLVFALSAHADRILPPGGSTGILAGHQHSPARLGDKTSRFSPGLRIYDQSNRTIVSGALPQTARVYYRLDSQGELFQVWLLTPEEQNRLGQQ